MAKSPRSKAKRARITLEELHRKMADPRTSQASLRKYFIIDEKRSGPFTPVLALNPETVAIPQTPEGAMRGDMAIGAANWFERMRRTSLFNHRIASGYDGPIIVSEGDSWFQFPILLNDTIDQLIKKGYAIRSLGAAGDTLENMIAKGEYIKALRQTGASVFLFSAGGNDVLGGGHLADHLRRFDPALSPAQHILPSFDGLLAGAIRGYDQVLRSVEALPGNIQVFCHGYDMPVPSSGKWLGKPMESRGIRDRAFQKGITDELIARFNTQLKALIGGFANAHFLDMRGVVGASAARWHDELHPKNPGYGKVADKFDAGIRSVAPRSFAGVPRPVPSGGTAARSFIRRAEGGGSRTGLSLHVGLNVIDQTHYGTDGKLSACIADAEAMKAIAEARGFEVMDLLTDARGTRDAVIGGISEAGRRLKPGDIFLYTYAGHGSQMHDFNQDETDNLDETWCLYDGMFLDDEAYQLWCGFEEGVRIFVVLDCCHSGSAIRAAPALFDAEGRQDGRKPRMLPVAVARQAFNSNPELYRRIGGSPQGGDESDELADDIALSSHRAPLRASVRLISGCQDNQVSMDGFFNGRFTEELLKVWNNGRFEGDYRTFHKTIVNGMPPTQTPNHFQIGQPDAAFDGQVPFTV
ncbi:MAG: caspase family protein [Rhizobiaceae bacterium]